MNFWLARFWKYNINVISKNLVSNCVIAMHSSVRKPTWIMLPLSHVLPRLYFFNHQVLLWDLQTWVLVPVFAELLFWNVVPCCHYELCLIFILKSYHILHLHTYMSFMIKSFGCLYIWMCTEYINKALLHECLWAQYFLIHVCIYKHI